MRSYTIIPTPRRPALKIVLEEAWRVKLDAVGQKQASIEISVEGQDESFKIDFRVPRVPERAVLEDEGRTRRTPKLAHSSKTHSRTEALITDLQNTDEFNPFSAESKRTINHP